MSQISLKEYLENCPSTYHAVQYSVKWLSDNGFAHVRESECLPLDKPAVYSRDSSSFVAYIPGEDTNAGFSAIASHTDSPVLKLTQNGEIKQFGSIFSIPCEPYSGPVLQRWIDRQLILAGRVTYLENGLLKFKYLKQGGFFIPGLAPHMLRGTDSKDWYPQDGDFVICCEQFSNVLKDKMQVHDFVKKIAELPEKAKITCIQLEISCGQIDESQQLIHAARLDNLASVYASIVALIQGKNVKQQHTRSIFAFCNEEIGSGTRAGATGPVIINWWRRLQNCPENKALAGLAKSVVASADGAHAEHPVKGANSCHFKIPQLGSGITLKISQKQNYAFTDQCTSAAIATCETSGVKYTQWIQKSYKMGGGTIGSIIATHDDVATFDFGVPMLSMHSCIETADKNDIKQCVDFCSAFLTVTCSIYKQVLNETFE